MQLPGMAQPRRDAKRGSIPREEALGESNGFSELKQVCAKVQLLRNLLCQYILLYV